VVFDYVGYSDLDRTVKSAVFDAGRWSFGYLRGATRTNGRITVDFDEATFLGEPLADDYARKHLHEQSAPDDYVIVNDSTATVATPLSPDAYVIGGSQVTGGDPNHPHRVSVSYLYDFLTGPDHGDPPFQIHLDARGVIDRVEEQYVP
jgi:hypothetical protein